jgi:hypothetical protein
MEEIQKSFKNITNLTIKNMADQVTSVETPDGSVSTTSQVFQYVTNIPAPIAQEIKTIVTEQNALGTMKPVTIQVPEDLVKQGAPKTITQSLMLDQANFFVLK